MSTLLDDVLQEMRLVEQPIEAQTEWLNQCHFGDVRDVLRKMIADGVKVQTIVTSPPYWGLRSYDEGAVTINPNLDAEQRAWVEAAKAETAWIPVAVLPAPCLKVIATYVNRLGNRRTIMAKWVPGKTEEAHSLDDEFGEYDEATDTTYAPEGWYEVIDNLDDCTFVAVGEGAITHWMPLPEAPDAIRTGAPPDTLREAGAVAGGAA